MKIQEHGEKRGEEKFNTIREIFVKLFYNKLIENGRRRLTRRETSSNAKYKNNSFVDAHFTCKLSEIEFFECCLNSVYSIFPPSVVVLTRAPVSPFVRPHFRVYKRNC